jgi:hypothetical protein
MVRYPTREGEQGVHVAAQGRECATLHVPLYDFGGAARGRTDARRHQGGPAVPFVHAK